MSQPRQSYDTMHVKGGLLRARFLFVVMNYGVEVWSQILSSLDENDRASLQEIGIDDWYPLSVLDQIDRRIAGHLGGDEQEVFEKLGEFSATSSLSGPYASLLNPDIHSFLKQSSLIHHAYQDFGEAAYERLSDTSGLLTIRYDPAPPPSFCTSGSAYFRHAIELCGARAAHITHARCAGRGDEACEFYITWQP
ncbi:MAG TPA: TIGR02265 family protein [Blastocatellia bacterium]|nr:TIGR02265 family protein [Blastocatellia bacterium]